MAYKEKSIPITAGFSVETPKAREAWSWAFQVDPKIPRSRSLRPAKLSAVVERERETSHVTNILKHPYLVTVGELPLSSSTMDGMGKGEMPIPPSACGRLEN